MCMRPFQFGPWKYFWLAVAIAQLVTSTAVASPVVDVSIQSQDAIVGLGQTQTVSIWAQVSNPASTDDGIMLFDVNATFDATGYLAIGPNSIDLPDADELIEPGTVTPTGLSACYGSYFYDRTRGIAQPKQLVRFDVIGLALGGATLTVSADTTAGADFLLHESDLFTVDYAGAHTALTVATPGDLNTDGDVSFLEAATTVANIGLTPAGWIEGDANGNGEVDLEDGQLAVGNYFTTTAPPSATSVPEPNPILMLMLTSVLLLGRRRWPYAVACVGVDRCARPK